MTGTRLGQVPGVDAAAERPVALALARVNYYHSASTAGTPHEPVPWCRESIVIPISRDDRQPGRDHRWRRLLS